MHDNFYILCDPFLKYTNILRMILDPYAIVQNHREVPPISADAPARHRSARFVNSASRLLDPMKRFQLAWLATPAR